MKTSLLSVLAEQQEKYVGYCRVSSSTQAKRGKSLSRQERAIRLFVKERNALLLDVFKDVKPGRQSAKKRLGLHAAINLCASENAILLISKTDRLGRDLDVIDVLE